MTKLSKGLTGSRSLVRWVFGISHTNASGRRESQEETLEFHGIPGCKIDAPHFFFFFTNMDSLAQETRSG